MGTPGHFTTVGGHRGRRDVAPCSCDATVAAALPGDLQAVTGAQAADESVAAVRKAVRFIPMALMAFVAVSLFVAAFLIVNTFSMLVSQRQREHGLLRAVGATSRQVFASVVAEALVVGAASPRPPGSGSASLPRYGLAPAAPGRSGWRCRTPTSRSRPSVAVVSLLGGHRGDAARRRRARRPRRPRPAGGRDPRPVDAHAARSSRAGRRRRSSVLAGRRRRPRRRRACAAGGTRTDSSASASGALVAFVGLGMLARHLVRPLVAVVGRPWARFLGVPGRLGTDHAARNPAAHRHDRGRAHRRARAGRADQRLLRVGRGVARAGRWTRVSVPTTW